jgi:tetratricopeptide (TPR) repeat protein
MNTMKNLNLMIAAGVVFSGIASAQTLNDAKRLTENEQFESAAKVFEQLIVAEPSNSSAYYYYGENYLQNDNAVQAKALYQKGVGLNANGPLNYVGLGKIEYINGNVAGATENFTKAKTLSQNKSAEVLMEIAEVYINSEKKNIAEALTLLNQAAKLEPKNPTVFMLIGDAYLEQNDGNNAIVNYEKALGLDKKFTKAILREGKLYSRAKNYTLALDYYNKAIEIDSSFAPAFRERAELRFRAGQSERAASDYKKYLQLNNDLSAQVRFCEFEFVSKHYKSVCEEGPKVLSRDTTYINIYRVMGYSFYEIGDYTNGLLYMNKYFQKALAAGKPFLASDYEYLGKNQIKNNDSLGVDNLLKALELDATRTDFYSEIAAAYMKQKNYPKAIIYYDKKINTDTTKATANDYLKLGQCFYNLKDYVKADSVFAKLIQIQPTSIYGYAYRARCNSQADPDTKQGLAKPFYEQLITVGLTDVEKNKKELIEAYSYLGYYYLVAKDYPKSKENWKKVLELDPTNEKATKALADPNLK